MVELIWALWGRLHIDLFITRDNHKLLAFLSQFLDAMAWATDAMSLSWKGMWTYAFPLFPLVPKVLVKIRAELVEIILVALWWPKRVWSLNLLELSMEPPRGAPTLGKTVNAAQVECIPSKSAGAPALRLETIAEGIRSAGFSEDMVDRVTRVKLCQYSLMVYDFHWKVFVLALPGGFHLGMRPCSK